MKRKCLGFCRFGLEFWLLNDSWLLAGWRLLAGLQMAGPLMVGPQKAGPLTAGPQVAGPQMEDGWAWLADGWGC